MRGFLIFFSFILLTLSAWAQGRDSSSKSSSPPVSIPFAGDNVEILHPDAAWCGPRVVYFFSCYFGNDNSLEEVTSLCKTNEEGYTSLLDLANACRSLGLEPTPISCSSDQILELGGPAIICVLGPGRKEGKSSRKSDNLQPQSPVVHFVGLLGRDEDKFVAFNPGLSTGCFRVSRQAIESEFTGHAILLRGCPRPPLWPWWLSFPWLFLMAGFIGLVIFALTRLAPRLRLYYPWALDRSSP